MKEDHFLIHRQIVEIGVSDAEAVPEIQNRISRLTYAMTEALSHVIEEVVPADMWVRLDTLEVDIGTLQASFRDEELIEALSRAFRDALQIQLYRHGTADTGTISPVDMSVRPVSHEIGDRIAAFMQTGVWTDTPGSLSPTRLAEVVSEWAEADPAQLRQLVRNMSRDGGSAALQRLIQHVPLRLLGRLLDLLLESPEPDLLAWIARTYGPSPDRQPVHPAEIRLWTSLLSQAAVHTRIRVLDLPVADHTSADISIGSVPVDPASALPITGRITPAVTVAPSDISAESLASGEGTSEKKIDNEDITASKVDISAAKIDDEAIAVSLRQYPETLSSPAVVTGMTPGTIPTLPPRTWQDLLAAYLTEQPLPEWILPDSWAMADWSRVSVWLLDQSPVQIMQLLTRLSVSVPEPWRTERLSTVLEPVRSSFLKIRHPHLAGLADTLNALLIRATRQAIWPQETERQIRWAVWWYMAMTPAVDAGRLTAVVLESATQITGRPAATWHAALTQLLQAAVEEGETRFAALSRIWETAIRGSNPLRQVVLVSPPAHEPAPTDPLAEPVTGGSPHDIPLTADAEAAWPAYFLRYGTLPTTAATLHWGELEAWIQAHPAQAVLAVRAGAAYPDLMERVLETVPAQVRQALLAILVPDQDMPWQDWGRHLGVALGPPSRVWAHLVQYLADPQHPQHTPQPVRWVQQLFRQEGQRRRQPVSTLIRQVADHPGIPAALAQHLAQVQARMTETEARRQPTAPMDVPEMIAVHNAGLVLLWPFLPHLFQKLGMLTPKRKFVSSEAQARAVMLSQYLATGKTQSAEYLLYLNKLLCAFPMQEYLPVSIEVTDAEEALVTQLYQAVSAQWSAAKNSTMEGLRNSFILRDGKLLQKNGNWYLQVQSRGVDALLASLPWGLQTIRLSWMETPLLVEWKSQQIR